MLERPPVPYGSRVCRVSAAVVRKQLEDPDMPA